MNSTLTDFIAHARKKGMDHQTIRMLLLSSGWKEKDIAQALTEQALEMPVPMPPDTGGAREAFFHLLTFASFFTTVISLIVLFFSYINRLFPDPALRDVYYPSSYDMSGIRWSLAAVIVAFPLFLLLSRFLLKEMSAHPEKSWSGIRRWLTYLTLFIAATAIMGDVITLVFQLLEGELTIRFLLKVLVVLVIAGLSFAYYFLSLRMPVEKKETKKMHRMFALIGSAITVIAIVWGIVLAGSPMSERLRKFDERRIEDFNVIRNEAATIVLDQTRHERPGERRIVNPLPQSLPELQEQAVYQKLEITDPQTGELYEYRVLNESTYELCAVFNFPRDHQYDIFWNHEAGRQCFTIDVLDPNY